MLAHRTRLLSGLAPLAILPLLGLACSAPTPTPTATGVPTVSTEWAEQTAETTSYRVLVRTGPAVSLAVMQQGASMATMDQGRPVNHHFEVHIFDKDSGAEMKSLVPVVTITDPATGTSWGVPNVQACLLANHRVTEPHFGDNLYIMDGAYPVTVAVGEEAAVFDNVVMPAPV